MNCCLFLNRGTVKNVAQERNASETKQIFVSKWKQPLFSIYLI